MNKENKGDWDGLNIINLASKIANNRYNKKELSITKTELSSQVFSTLLNALIPNETIEVLNLSDNKISEKDISLLFAELKKNISITKLIMKGIPISQKNLQDLFDLFSINIKIGEVEMEVDEETWKKMKKGKEDNPKLQFQSYLRSNKNIQTLVKHLEKEEKTSYEEYQHNMKSRYSMYTDEEESSRSESPTIFSMSLDSSELKKTVKVLAPSFINFSNRNAFVVPPIIFKFLSISDLNLSHNNLEEIPNEIEQLCYLKRLNFDHNHIKVIPESISFLEELKYFSIANNQVDIVPLYLRALGNLKEINLEHNKIKVLPFFLSTLENLKKLELQGNLAYKSIPKKITEGKGKEIIGFLKSSLNNNQKSSSSVLMILGSRNVGKSSLMSSLLNTQVRNRRGSFFKSKEYEKSAVDKRKSRNMEVDDKFEHISFDNFQKKDVLENINSISEQNETINSNNNEKEVSTFEIKSTESSEGVSMTKWSIHTGIERSNSNTQQMNSKLFDFTVPNFSGNDIDQRIYKIFMSRRAVYMVCFNIIEPQEPVSKLEYWLQLIKKDACSAPVILVGTYCQEEELSKETTKKIEMHIVENFFGRFKNIVDFVVVDFKRSKKKEFVNLQQKIMKITGKTMGEMISLNYLTVREKIRILKSRYTSPLLHYDVYRRMVMRCGVSAQQLDAATQFLFELEEIFCCESNTKFVCIDRDWIARLYRKVLSVESAKWGVIKREEITKILSVKQNELDFLFDCWEQLDLVLSVKNDNGIVIVPSLFYNTPQDLETHWPKFAIGPQLSRIYIFEYLESVIFHKLIARLFGMGWAFRCCWNRGVVFSVENDTCLIEIDSNTGTMIIHVRGPTCGASLFTILECFESLFERNLNAKVFVPCIHCMNNPSSETHLFTLQECEEAYSNGENQLFCKEFLPIDLYSLAPDVAMNHINQFTFEEVSIQGALGEGSYAVVHKAIYKENLVALKQFHFDVGEMEMTAEKLKKKQPSRGRPPSGKFVINKKKGKETTWRDVIGYEENSTESNSPGLLPQKSPFKSLQGIFSRNDNNNNSNSGNITDRIMENSKDELKQIKRANTMVDMRSQMMKGQQLQNNNNNKSQSPVTQHFDYFWSSAPSQTESVNNEGGIEEDVVISKSYSPGMLLGSPPTPNKGNLLNSFMPQSPPRSNGFGSNSYSSIFTMDSPQKKQKNLGSIFGSPVVKSKNMHPSSTKQENKQESQQRVDPTVNRMVLKLFTDFRREVCLMTMLSHPNIVVLNGICRNPLSMMMEYMNLGSLFSYIHDKEREMTGKLKLSISKSIADGMNFLHSRNPPIIHRDLKSPNVLLHLTEDNKIITKVTDFGLSTSVSEITGRVVDNPVWLAPEIIKRGKHTTSSDVYAYGVILWEIATRSQFFSEITFQSEIEEKVLAGERPNIPQDICSKIISLILKCWSSEPKNRPNFSEIVDALSILSNFDTNDSVVIEKEPSESEINLDILNKKNLLIEENNNNNSNNNNSTHNPKKSPITIENLITPNTFWEDENDSSYDEQRASFILDLISTNKSKKNNKNKQVRNLRSN